MVALRLICLDSTFLHTYNSIPYNLIPYTSIDMLVIGESAKLVATFKNPLPVEMKDVTLNVDVDDLYDG